MKRSVTLRRISLLLAALILAVACIGCGPPTEKEPPETTVLTTKAQPDAEHTEPAHESVFEPAADPRVEAEAGKDAEYLAFYFGVQADEWNAERFGAALEAIAGEDAAEVSGELTGPVAIRAAVESSGYAELANTYPEEKVAARLEAYGLSKDTSEGAYVACALDSGLLSAADAKAMLETGPSKEAGEALLMQVAASLGRARNSLGYSDDPETVTRLIKRWDSFVLFDDTELVTIGKTAVEQKVTTGYNLKNETFAARFLPAYTLQYGHDNIRHAQQLLALLNSEGIVAQVQLEPKTSVFQYLLEWGPVPDPTPTYEVKKFSDDLYLAFAVEYDLQLEFLTEEDMLRFDDIVKTYAKKYEGNEEGEGLIFASWWQPLYTGTRDDLPPADYYKIMDCVMVNGDYSIHPFCLAEAYDETVEALEAISDGAIKVEGVARYCNEAFHNYLKGDDFQ